MLLVQGNRSARMLRVSRIACDERMLQLSAGATPGSALGATKKSPHKSYGGASIAGIDKLNGIELSPLRVIGRDTQRQQQPL